MASETRPRSVPKRTPLTQEEDARLESGDRRAFFRRSAAVAGGALAAGGLASAARSAPLAVAPTNKEMGRPIEPAAYGMPSKFEPATGNPRLNGALIEADDKTGRATRITRVSYSEQELDRLAADARAVGARP